MTLEEIYVTYEALKKEGYTKEKLFCATCKMFLTDQMDIKELKEAIRVLGYKLSDELLTYPIDKQKALIDNYVKGFALEYDIKEFK